jgi:hypothetical protein
MIVKMKYKVFFLSLPYFLFLFSCEENKLSTHSNASTLESHKKKSESSEEGEKEPEKPKYDENMPENHGNSKKESGLPIPTKYSQCENIAPLFKNPKSHQISSSQLRTIYKFEKELAGSLSGSKVFIVTPSNNFSFKIILKTLSDVFFSAGDNFNEVLLMCKNAAITSSYYLPDTIKAGIFFPTLYDIGMIDSINPFALTPTISPSPVPYFTMELIEGMALIDFVEQAEEAKTIFGFNLETAAKDFLKGILLQLSIALLNADKSFGFRHTDLHPGNLMISTKQITISTTINNKAIYYNGPLIKIIDFGSGYDKDHEPMVIKKLAHSLLKEREERLIEHERPKASTVEIFAYKQRMKANLAQYMFERDIRSINFYLQVFKKRLKKQGVKNVAFCDTYKECTELIASWW